MAQTVIAPSILSCDFGQATVECADVVAKGAEWLHVDVMDGHFVPNISLGVPVVASLRKGLGAATYLDCHLMVSHPAQWVADFAKAGASGYTFHIEAVQEDKGRCPPAAYDPARLPETTAKAAALCEQIRAAGMKAGVAVKPGTPAAAVAALVERRLVDLVLVMTVEPGFGGQKFMGDMMAKVAEVRAMCDAAFAAAGGEAGGATRIHVEVDGGLDPSTAPAAGKAGANAIVAGTAVYKADDRAAAIAAIRKGIDDHKPTA